MFNLRRVEPVDRTGRGHPEPHGVKKLKSQDPLSYGRGDKVSELNSRIKASLRGRASDRVGLRSSHITPVGERKQIRVVQFRIQVVYEISY